MKPSGCTATPDALISAVPCPFCGSTFASKVEVKGGFRLRCPCCDAQTGVATEDDILKGYWERRPFAQSATASPNKEKLVDLTTWLRIYLNLDDKAYDIADAAVEYIAGQLSTQSATAAPKEMFTGDAVEAYLMHATAPITPQDLRSIAFRLGQLVEQYGHPDWTADEMLDAMTDLVDRLTLLADTADSPVSKEAP